MKKLCSPQTWGARGAQANLILFITRKTMTPLTDSQQEKAFLEAMANHFGFKAKAKVVFVQRFLSSNDDLNNQKLAEVIADDLIADIKSSDAARIFKDYLAKNICPRLEKAGCDFGNTTRGKWKIAQNWLQEKKFPQWQEKQPLIPVTIKQLWHRLVDLAAPGLNMGPVLANTLNMWGEYEECVPLGSSIKFVVNLPQPGYLILLEQGTSGDIFCLSPSFLAPRPMFDRGRVSLPQKGASRTAFKITGNPGTEKIVAAITPEKPSLSWLPGGKQKPLTIRESHLQDLLLYLQKAKAARVFYTEYTVTG